MSTDKYRNRLITLLKELFQLDQPELDFGLYKIMHAKSVQISQFLENDLLKEIEQAFGKADGDRIAQAKAAYDAALEQAKKFGAPDPENTDGVKEAKAAYENAKDGGNAETEIYDHLYRFFERYYDNGDFMSRRYYARESDNRAAPYAVPYDGREVYLHWANKDQYYIKSSEYLTNYTFELNEAIRKEVERQKQGQSKTAAFDFDDLNNATPRKVHLRIVGASEGEHSNIKAGNDQKRFFIIHAEEPVKLENGELVIQFQYRIDTEKSGQDKKWQQTRLDQAQEAIVAALQALPDASAFLQPLQLPAPTDAEKTRTLLLKHLQKYSNRNTMDYFIHKDLGGFLRRELDFYIKNEIMRLDDIENAEAPKVEQYLAKIKVLRRIAHQLIAFLAQLENFQKKLWLKKKFVTETQHCITLDRIPESFYPEIAANEAQYQEWERLFTISKINQETSQRSVDFLKENSFLMIDTVFFDDFFKAQLLNEIQNLDEQCDGLILNSENFQALNLIKTRHQASISCVYFDPPYNTGDDGFVYKDRYKSSSWSSMMNQVVHKLHNLLKEDGSLFANCDENEFLNFGYVLRSVFEEDNHVETITWNKRVPKNDKGIGNIHEYIYLFAKNQKMRRASERGFVMRKDSLEEIYELIAKEKKKRTNLKETQRELKKFYKKQGFDRGITLYSELDPNYEIFGKINMSWPNAKTEGPRYEVINPATGMPAPIPDRGWRWKEETFRDAENDGPTFQLPDGSIVKGRIWYSSKDTVQPSSITYLRDVESFLLRSIVSLKSDGSMQLENLGLSGLVDYPKPVKLAEWIFYSTEERSGYFLDCFAGSGTAAHGLLSLNREYPGNRKYLLIEMGEHFDTALRPRISKVVYSDNWKAGLPTTRNSGISHHFKYLRLENYEDSLNNLILMPDERRDAVLTNSPTLQRDYLLNYFLDVETDGSQSLLNIYDFRDPTAYKMWIKKPGSDEQVLQNIDLIETFNWLLGLWVDHLAAPQSFSAEFDRESDPDLPGDQSTRLICKRLRVETNGEYWFRLVEGYTLRVPGDDSTKILTLIIWRKLTDDAEKDNAALQRYLETIGVSTREKTYEVIYVNGSHTLPNPVVEGEQTKVRLTEDAFHQAMWAEA